MFSVENRSLYRFLIVCVLAATGCSGEEPVKLQRSAEAISPAKEAPAKPRILIIGDSITAGYGLPREQAFPALIQARIDSAGLNFEVVNAGLSGETTAGGARRIKWLLQQPVHVLVIELGGNDGLRGVDPDDTRRNLEAMIDAVREQYPDARIVLGGMRMPMNMGSDYRSRFETVFSEVANGKGVVLIPHILEGVGGIPEMNQPDGIHPTAEGQAVIASTVWQTIEPLL